MSQDSFQRCMSKTRCGQENYVNVYFLKINWFERNNCKKIFRWRFRQTSSPPHTHIMVVAAEDRSLRTLFDLLLLESTPISVCLFSQKSNHSTHNFSWIVLSSHNLERTQYFIFSIKKQLLNHDYIDIVFYKAD